MLNRPWLPGLFSGALLGASLLAHGPLPWQWAMFFGYLPLWAYWLRETRTIRIAAAGWVCQFTLSFVSCHWIAHTVNEFSHLGAALSVAALLLFCALANLHIPLAGFAWARLIPIQHRRSPSAIASLALLTALGERAGTMIFHWNYGYAWLYLGLPGAQLADVAGFRWLCTLTICLNGLLAMAWIQRRSRATLLPLGLALAAFAGVNLAGAVRLRALPPPDASARVLLVQPNVGNRDKEKLERDDAGFRQRELSSLFSLTERALAEIAPVKPDFAVWPENAFPGYIADVPLTFGLTPKLRDFLRAHDLNLVTGAYGMSADGKTTNGLFALHRSGLWSAPAYEKRMLLPFGEYIPGAGIFPSLKRWLPDVRDYARGGSPAPLRLGDLRIGGQICYEGLFDTLARDLANSGAQLIVNVTNDSWYGEWPEPWQHLYATAAKAVETRRPLIRDTNTGVSAVALADGSLLALSPIGRAWYQLVEVPYRKSPRPTPFQGWGFWIDWCFLGGGLAVSLALSFRGRSRGATRA